MDLSDSRTDISISSLFSACQRISLPGIRTGLPSSNTFPSSPCHCLRPRKSGYELTPIAHNRAAFQLKNTVGLSNVVYFGAQYIHFRCGLATLVGRLHSTRYLLECGLDNRLPVRLCLYRISTGWNASASLGALFSRPYIEEGPEDSLRFYHFPEIDKKRISSTNVVERIVREIRRRSQVIGVFPTVDSYVRLVTCYLIEYSED